MYEDKKLRILILSIDVWNKNSGSDTFPNLMSGYDPDCVANIYFKGGLPDSKTCNSYFHISENAVIKSILKRSIQTGAVVSRSFENAEDIWIEEKIESKRYRFFSRHRLSIFLLGREFLWKIGKWHSQSLDDFILNFNPDVVFFPLEGYIYFNRISKYIMDQYKIPAIGYLWDDNFTYQGHPFNPLFCLNRFILRKQIKGIVRKCRHTFAISPKMQDDCFRELGITPELLTKGACIPAHHIENAAHSKPVRFVYTGKLNIGRLKPVQMLASVLSEYNTDDQYEFNIYSGTHLSSREIDSLTFSGVHFMGSVPQDQIREIQSNADVLVMAEALHGAHKYDARLSFSTKIVDYLISGKCILAIGPRDISPIEYLFNEDAALIASNQKEIESLFMEHAFTFEKLCDMGNRAAELAAKNHNITEVQRLLYKTFSDVVY